MTKIILASASPRRSELLRQVGISFSILPSDAEEHIDVRLAPEEVAVQLSYIKASSVAAHISDNALVIGADTIVVSGGILGKPRDDAEAFEMLKKLQGNWHEVITGVTVINAPSFEIRKNYEKTRVKMRDLSDDMIRSYIRTGEPRDKAGAYGIQGVGALLVERLEGCYFNVVGLPLVKVSAMLEEFGVRRL